MHSRRGSRTTSNVHTYVRSYQVLVQMPAQPWGCSTWGRDRERKRQTCNKFHSQCISLVYVPEKLSAAEPPECILEIN